MEYKVIFIIMIGAASLLMAALSAGVTYMIYRSKAKKIHQKQEHEESNGGHGQSKDDDQKTMKGHQNE